MRLLYDLAAFVTTVLLIVPAALLAGVLAMYEVFKVFPHNVIDIFDQLYKER